MFRKCSYFCNKLVEGKPLDPEPQLCEEHKDKREYVILRNVRQRHIGIDYFRMYDKDRNPLCIFCGKPTYKRSRTFCDDKLHNSDMYHSLINMKYNFSFIRDCYCGSECHICGVKSTVYNWRDPKKTIKMNYHHIIPVHKLDVTNWLLVFDTKNLITLCEKCHKLIHSKEIVENNNIVKEKKYKEISDFLKK